MDFTEELYNQIRAYLDNQMPPTNRKAFEQRLAEETDLRQEVDTQRRIDRGLQAEVMKHRLTTLHRTTRRQQRIRLVGRVVLAAVVLLVGVYGLREWLFVYAPQQLAMAYLPEAPDRGERVWPTGLVDAVNAYHEGNYANALSQLTALPTDSERLVSYYRGLTLLALKRYPEAIVPFEQARQSSDVLMRQKADWRLALTYLLLGDEAKGRALLGTIRDTPDHQHRQDAATLLEKLS